jgi:hypothetical protein
MIEKGTGFSMLALRRSVSGRTIKAVKHGRFCEQWCQLGGMEDEATSYMLTIEDVGHVWWELRIP